MDGIENDNKPDILLEFDNYLTGLQDTIHKQKDFWISEFSEEMSVLELPADFKRSSIKGYKSDSVKFELSCEETERLRSISIGEKSSLYMLWLSIYNILLSKLSNQEDIIVGMPVIVSEHVNTLPLRNYPKSELCFRDFLSILKVRTLACLNNSAYPYEDLIKEIKLEQDISRNPLFDVMFLYKGVDEPGLKIPTLSSQKYNCGQNFAKFDLTLSVDLALLVTEVDGKLCLSFEYSIDLFKKETIERFVSYVKKIVSTVIANPDERISEIEIVSETEKLQILYEFNDTVVNFPREKTIKEAFEETVIDNLNADAVVFKGEVLTYEALNERSNQMANEIVINGIQKGSFIGILLPRSTEMLVSLLGVLKAGCAYIPIDPAYPVDRIKYIIENSGFSLLLSAPSLYEIYTQFDKSVKVLDATSGDIFKNNKENLKTEFLSSNPAYLIYTSGSTGNPKGITIENRNVINFIQGVTNKIHFTKGSTILCLTTISFDIFVLESILPLLKGLRVVLTDSKEPGILSKLIRDHNIDYLQITPSHLKILLSDVNSNDILNRIKILMVGGEAFPTDLLNELSNRKFNGRIYNMYGPTETTVWSTIKELTYANPINIGVPIANTIIRIIDKNKKLQPIGVVGELCIGGEGLSRGYWNNEQLTSDKFITDPITNEGKVFQTGDLGKWLPDGNIECLGRIDNQIKLRGFRIELGEIECNLMSYGKIKEAIVVVHEKEKNANLVAYYTSDGEITATELRDYLSRMLPDYMVPAFYVHLTSIPLTPNGKINRKALPNPKIKKTDDYIAPSSEIEKKLVDIWADVLGINKEVIGIDHNFFMLGGNSLNAIKTVHKLKEYIQNIRPNDIFVHPTIRELTDLYSIKTENNSKKYRDVFDIENKLKEIFNMEARLFKYKLSNNMNLIVLFLDKKITTNKINFIKFIESELEEAYQPHYIIENERMIVSNDQEREISMKEKDFFRFIYKMRLFVSF